MAMVFALLLVKKALVETNRFFPLPISLISNESSFPSSETIIAFLFMKQPTLNKKKPIKANNDIKLLRCVSKSAPASIRIATKDTTLLAFTAVAAGPEFNPNCLAYRIEIKGTGAVSANVNTANPLAPMNWYMFNAIAVAAMSNPLPYRINNKVTTSETSLLLISGSNNIPSDNNANGFAATAKDPKN
jgi:hypothetical protein